MQTKSSKSLHLQTGPCSIGQFEEVKTHIRAFELDDRELNPDQFLVASEGSTMLGFGRIREYDGFSEMCSLGVIQTYRSKGIGKKICQALIQKNSQTLYLVCIIPEYFTSLGFSVCDTYPKEIKNKLDYCTGSLPVEEKYVVMKLN